MTVTDSPARGRADMSPTATRTPFARMRRRSIGHNRMKLLFLAPGAVIFAVVVLIPIAINFFYSFTDWTGYGDVFNFVALQNFQSLLQDVDTRRAFGNTLVFTVVNAPLQISVGLLMALTLKRNGRVVSLLRVTVVMPIAISGVVLGFLGNLIFDPNTGLLRGAADITGLEGLAQNWLGNSTLAMVSVITMNIWQWSGLTMLIFLAGLATIPQELYEAAILDGATPLHQFRYVTWPLLAPSVTINTVLTIIGGLKVFDIIYVLTKGGPGGATESIVMRVSAQGSFAKYGYSAAMSFTLTVIILLISLALLFILRRRELRA